MDDIGRDEAKTAVLQKGGTVVDEREMSRMGKKQELKVCDAMISFRSVFADDRDSATSSSSVGTPYRGPNVLCGREKSSVRALTSINLTRHRLLRHHPPEHMGMHDLE